MNRASGLTLYAIFLISSILIGIGNAQIALRTRFVLMMEAQNYVSLLKQFFFNVVQ